MAGKSKDLTGKRFGRLLVLGPTTEKRQISIIWKCLCDCGSLTMIAGNDLTRTRSPTRSCGCAGKEKARKRFLQINKNRIIDLTGQKIGKWTVLQYAGKKKWLCRCGCGTLKAVRGHDLRYGISKSCGCSRIGRRGPGTPHWNPNLTAKDRELGRNIPGYKEWRKAVYERDEYTCQYCGDKSGHNLTAHHIESYADNPKLRTTVENGVTLCEDCHDDFHHQYGKGNNTRKQFKQFLQGREGILL